MKKNIGILAFVLSIIGFFTGCFLVGIVLDIIALILGIQELKKKEDKGFATAAIIISIIGIIMTVIFYSFVIFTDKKTVTKTEVTKKEVVQLTTETQKKVQKEKETEKKENSSKLTTETTSESKSTESSQAQTTSSETQTTSKDSSATSTTYQYNGKNYKIIVVDGGDMSGTRQPNVAVDIGFGDRTYWGLTNESGQLVYVIANTVTLQDATKEKVNASGRYYNDEANVQGTERSDLDKGHVIADSLGGVSNAYNITPQDSTLNRHGDQAYMEKNIRDAGGCTSFVATITYPDATTMIPSHYHFEYVLKGNPVVDDFDNKNSEKSSATSNSTSKSQANSGTTTDSSASDNATNSTVSSASSSSTTSSSVSTEDEASKLAQVDKNGDGKVTIAEAKAAGYSMPIYSSSWLYKYMDDRDHDGEVGE